jgi:arginase family enzyme
VQIGIRTAGAHLREQARRFGVETIEMRDWRGAPDLALEGPLYVSVDLDVLDPAFAPGISHPEPGGCSVRQLVDSLHALHAPIVAADVVEYNPRLDARGLTGMVAAKVVKELAATANR